MFKKIKDIDHVNFCLRIGENYIFYYSGDYVLKMIDRENMTLSYEHQFLRDFDFEIVKDNLFISGDSELFSFDTKNLELKKVFNINHQHIRALSSHRFLASTYQRKDKKYNNSIYAKNGKLLWELRGEMSFRDIYVSHLLLSDKRGSKIGYLDFEDCNLLWQKDLEGIINGESIETKAIMIIPLSNGLVAFDVKSGDKVWSNDYSLSHYNYEERNNKIYGLKDRSFEVVDVNTGKREVQELSENLQIASHLTFYFDGLLYFSGYRNENIPVIGAVNINDGSLAFTKEVEMPGEKSFRKGLDRPVVIGNRLYVRDALKTLHIFEKENKET